MAWGFGVELLFHSLFAKGENGGSQFCQPHFQASLERDRSTTGRRIITTSQVEQRGAVASGGAAVLDLNAQLKAYTLRADTLSMCFSVTEPGNKSKSKTPLLHPFLQLMSRNS